MSAESVCSGSMSESVCSESGFTESGFTELVFARSQHPWGAMTLAGAMSQAVAGSTLIDPCPVPRIRSAAGAGIAERVMPGVGWAPLQNLLARVTRPDCGLVDCGLGGRGLGDPGLVTPTLMTWQ
jgi:hypothetical protein